ncbi:uncharacterized protein LOC109827143 [Asparagus officinalis]|uniref:uncharacterized protein LOC109827143 n=1 Tax=Asparagus officinalis TaxID=4686 RepID=UPI00098E0429|nr:uncharacterized protein LOC109827143 [Asparagus officinalis]
MANGVPIICLFNGKLSVGMNNMPIYDGGSRKMFMLSRNYNFDRLVAQIYRVTGINHVENSIKIFCNCPINDQRTIAVEITNDEELNNMIQLAEKQVSIELFIENIPVYSVAEVSYARGEFSRMLDNQISLSQSAMRFKNESGAMSNDVFHNSPGYVSVDLPGGSTIAEDNDEDVDADDDTEDAEEDERLDSMQYAIGETNDDVSWMDEYCVNNDYVESEEPLPEEFQNDEWINASQAEFVDPGPNFDPSEDFTFKKGDLFENKETLIFAIREWTIKNRVKFKTVKSNTTSYHVKCYFNERGQGENTSAADDRNSKCPWKLNAAIRKKSLGQFIISSYCGLHTCSNSTATYDHKTLTSSYIAKLIMPEVRRELDLTPGQIITRVYDMKRITISKFKAYDARRKALTKIFGDWEESYQLLPHYLSAIVRNNPGTEYDIVSKEVAPETERFICVFWAFGPAIRGFSFCRPLLSIDGTHLYGKYKGVILVATGVDANGGLFPVAFAVVEVEDTSSWKWFFQCIYKYIPTVQSPRVITFISDRMKGIPRALHEGWSAPHHHRYCLRHIRANFKKKHGEVNLQNLLWQAGCATDSLVYEHCREKIKSISLEAHDWIEQNLKPQYEDRWALCKDGGVRYCMMTTNCSESFNGVLKGARAMPIQALVARTFYRLNAYFNKRRIDSANWTSKYTPKNEIILQKRIVAVRTCRIEQFNNNEWEVKDCDENPMSTRFSS